MTAESQPPKHLINQSVVRFSSGNLTSHAYSNTVDTPVVGPVITIRKKANTSEAVLGQVITYTLTIANKGNLDAQVTLFDTMPDGTSLVPNSVIVDGVPMPMAKPDKGIYVGTIHIGQHIEVNFQVVILHPSSQLKNQATATYTFHTAGGRSATGSSKSNTVIIPFEETKISFKKHADKPYTFVGDTVTFLFTIKNEGSYTINKMLFIDRLPTSVRFVAGSVKIGHTSYPSANPADGISLSELPAHETLSLQFQVTVTHAPSSGRIVNDAELVLHLRDHKQKMTSNSISLEVYDPAISVVESVLQPKATLGDTLTYSLIVANKGNIAAEIWLSDFIPEGSSYVLGSLTVNGTPYGNSLLTSSVYVGQLPAKNQMAVTFQVTVNAVAISAEQTELTSHTDVLYNFRLPDDRVVSDHVLSNTVSVELLRPIVTIVVFANPLIAEPESTVHYRIQVSNSGNLAAGSVFLHDWISPLTTLNAATLRINGTPMNQILSSSQPLSLGVILPQATTEITYSATVVLRPNAKRIPLRASAKYVYQVNDPVHTGTALSNEVVIRIEEAEE
ncbi:DUF11 domain-containing protein [Paenibacillus chondroitinus]|uniref:DUF11 domain-containing protein n=1 Tax=Paenibacillus chondroitinus TaxID=59842 RepID=A0ABU6DDQ1_9BACL|nr:MULTISPECIES: DUF11 domain-containing protein [Paenibacillus]MCY9663013.1 DUF11 domain-containing protein [Paenibacillus anseongense]MEB4795868.1 DUF11 domain-containing protein [Paenibacillus chondroitinus]